MSTGVAVTCATHGLSVPSRQQRHNNQLPPSIGTACATRDSGAQVPNAQSCHLLAVELSLKACPRLQRERTIEAASWLPPVTRTRSSSHRRQRSQIECAHVLLITGGQAARARPGRPVLLEHLRELSPARPMTRTAPVTRARGVADARARNGRSVHLARPKLNLQAQSEIERAPA